MEKVVVRALQVMSSLLKYLNSYDAQCDWNANIPNEKSASVAPDPFSRKVIDIEPLRSLMTMRGLLGPEATVDAVNEALVSFNETGEVDNILEYYSVRNKAHGFFKPS